MDDATGSQSPLLRERKPRTTAKTRQRRHSSLQMDRNSLAVTGSQSELDGAKRNSKIQIFKVFGVHLPLLLRKERTLMGINETPRMSIVREETNEHHSIPKLVFVTVEHLKKSEGYKAPGIFRQCGKHSELLKAQDQIDKGSMITKEQLDELDAHTVGDILKTFLRLLPHPLIPVEDFYAHFLVSTKLEEKQQYISFLGSLIQTLPIDRRALLDYLCDFFHEIVEHSDENLMGAPNLAIIFSPSFFGQSATTDSTKIVMEAKAISKITQTLIEYYPQIFKKKHYPMDFLVVRESFEQMNISLLKGEEVLWFMLNDFDDCGFLLVGGRLHYLPKDFVNSKCNPKPKQTYDETLVSPRRADEEEAREDALRMLTGVKSNLISKATYIAAGSQAGEERDRVIAQVVAAAKEAKATKKGHLRRKSSEIFNLVVSRKETDKDDEKEKEKKEEKKEKKSKKTKQKKINSTVTNWYQSNSAATKSTNSFFLMRAMGSKPDLITRKGPKKKSKAQERIERRRLNNSSPACTVDPLAKLEKEVNKEKPSPARRSSVHFSEADIIRKCTD